MVAADQSQTSADNYIVQLLTSLGGTICFVALVILFVSKIFSTLTNCCKSLFGKKDHNSLRNNNDVNDNSFLRTSKNARYEQLRPGMKTRPTSLSVDSLDSYKTAMFEIPGMITANAIQPIENSSGYSSYPESVNSENTDASSCRAFSEEAVQPNERELYPSAAPTRKITVPKQVQFRKTWHSESFDQSTEFVETFKPELYEPKLRRTQMVGSLGKMKFSLQYEDKTKRKLIMSLHELMDLQYVKGTEQIVGLYITAMLIPERDYRFQTKQLTRDSNIKLDEVFTFHSRPHNRDFEARTIHITVVYVERSSKEIVYGESRMPLLSHEIYSQVPTELTIGIKPSPPNVSLKLKFLLLHIPLIQIYALFFMESLKIKNLLLLYNEISLTL